MLVVPRPFVEVSSRLYWPVTVAFAAAGLAGAVEVDEGAWPPPPPPAKAIARLIDAKRPSFVLFLIRCMTASLGLILVVVSVVASGAQGVSRYIIGHDSAQPICAHTAGSEVNAAKDARIGDFRGRFREAGI